MLFHAFLEATKAGTTLLALEEPEAHLHPSAIRSLWAFLEKLPGQKVITTHSGDLISEVPLASLRRLARTSTGIKAYRLNTRDLDDNQLRQFEFHVRHSRGELLFARCWLLVEGETEVTLLPVVARRLAMPLERYGVRCVPYRQSDVGLYLAIAKQLGIHWCMLRDSDAQGEKDLKKAQEACTLPESDVIFSMPGKDIEEYLASNGFLDVYESRVAEQKKASITAKRGDAAYTRQVLDALPSKAGVKTSAAIEIAARDARVGRRPA
jgi:putative ATP-dependent endonuclease of OLD family